MSASPHHRLPSRLLLLLALGATACGHPIEDGTWRLQQDLRQATTLDTCALLPADGKLGEGGLLVTGVAVRLVIPVPGPSTPVPMVGRFKNPLGGEPDEFFLEGSVSDERMVVRGASCPVQFGQSQLQATVQDAGTFTGTLKARYELGPSGEASCPATCDVEVGVRGDRQAK
ncbi:MAG TPA: hypothetical protein VGK67_35345 [Myxococcales bacterium]|jgi:hypothetical protein